MFDLQFELSRRAALGGGVLLLAASGEALAQAGDRTKRMQGWVDHVLKTDTISPMTNARLLEFSADVVRRKQVGIELDGVHRLFAVVVPPQRDGIILAMGFKGSKTFNVHRTGTHLRRVGSGRNIGGEVSRWSGAESKADFEAQVAFWASRPVA